MPEASDYIDEVGQVIAALRATGSTPILVGGMALVILGSRRVTKDFDFLISEELREQKELLHILYKRGFELASQVDKHGNIVTTIANRKVAGIRLKLDTPASAYFLNRKTGLRIDFLFDFPLSADELLLNAQKKKIRSHTFYIASKADLIRLKNIAAKKRSFAADKQDLEFLKTQ